MKQRTMLVVLSIAALTTFGCSKSAHHAESKAPEQSATVTTSVDSTKTDSTATVKTQTTCPIMGGDVDTALFVDQDGKRIYVCCTDCLEKVKADFASAEKALEKIGQKPAEAK